MSRFDKDDGWHETTNPLHTPEHKANPDTFGGPELDVLGGGGGGGVGVNVYDEKVPSAGPDASSGGKDALKNQSSRLFVGTHLWSRFLSAAVDARHKTFPYANQKGGIPFATKLVYALPQFSLTSLTLLIGIHGTLFYNKAGADVAFIAFFTAFARSFDVITDPMMGWWSDKARHPMGRRRPFMRNGLLGYGVVFILLFTPPASLGGSATALWFGVWYILFYAFDTLANVPYSALAPELSDRSDERDSLFFWSKLINGLGILIAAVGPVMLTVFFRDCDYCDVDCPLGQDNAVALNVTWNPSWGSLPSSDYNTTSCPSSGVFTELCCGLETWCQCREDCDGDCDLVAARKAMLAIATFFGLFYILSMSLCVFALRERETSSETEAPPLIPSLIGTLRNKPFVGLLPAWVMDMTAYTMLGTMLPFFVEYVIDPGSVPECSDGKRAVLGFDSDGQDPSKESESWCKAEVWLGVGLVVLIGAQIVAMPFWLWLTKTRLGKFRTWLVFNLTNSVTNALFVFAGAGDPRLCTLFAIINGIPAGAQFLTDSIVADVIDYDELHTGLRSEGRFTIFQTFIPKIVSIPAQAIPLALLSYVGFVPPENGVTQKQPDSVITFIKIVFFVIPSFLSIGSFFIKRKFPINSREITTKITEGVALHMKGSPAVDPVTGKTVQLLKITDEERRVSWDLDCFFPAQLRTMTSKGGIDQVTAGIRTNRNRFIMGLSLFACVTIVTIAIGGLGNDKISWIPAFSIILCGLCLTGTGFQHIRLQTAERLRISPPDSKFLQRWLRHVAGTEDGFETNAALAANVLKLEERTVTRGKRRFSTVELVSLVDDPAFSGGIGSAGGVSGLRRRLPRSLDDDVARLRRQTSPVLHMGGKLNEEDDDDDDDDSDKDDGDKGDGDGASEKRRSLLAPLEAPSLPASVPSSPATELLGDDGASAPSSPAISPSPSPPLPPSSLPDVPEVP